MRYKNSPCPGLANFHASLAIVPITCPASNPKLKQALSTPDTIDTNMPKANLYSVLEALAAAALNSFSFITPAFPLTIIPTMQINNPNSTVMPQPECSIMLKVSLSATG